MSKKKYNQITLERLKDFTIVTINRYLKRNRDILKEKQIEKIEKTIKELKLSNSKFVDKFKKSEFLKYILKILYTTGTVDGEGVYKDEIDLVKLTDIWIYIAKYRYDKEKLEEELREKNERRNK